MIFISKNPFLSHFFASVDTVTKGRRLLFTIFWYHNTQLTTPVESPVTELTEYTPIATLQIYQGFNALLFVKKAVTE